jgi:hypothetical protein
MRQVKKLKRNIIKIKNKRKLKVAALKNKKSKNLKQLNKKIK